MSLPIAVRYSSVDSSRFHRLDTISAMPLTTAEMPCATRFPAATVRVSRPLLAFVALPSMSSSASPMSSVAFAAPSISLSTFES